jgi:hypothetical protein
MSQPTKQTLDAAEHQKDLEEQRVKRIESINFLISWEEAERRKKSAIHTEFQ